MTTTGELDFSGSPGLNTDIGGVSIAEGIPPGNINDAIRAMAAFRHDATTRIVGKAAGTYTAVKADHNQFWYCFGGAVTINLTAAATLGNGWSMWIKAASGTVVIDPAGSELIETVASVTLAIGFSAQIICSGVDFYIVLASAGSDGVTLTGTQTLTNKTLTTPAIANGTFSGTSIFTGNISGTTGGFTGAVSMAGLTATTGDFSTYITAVGGNMAMSAATGIRYFQYETGYYWEFNTSTKLLRWMRGGAEEFHIGDSGTSTTARVFSEAGYFIATGTDGVFACTGTNLTGTLYLRPRGADVGTFQAALSSVTGTMTITNISETSDATLKSDWTPITKSVVDDIATLEIGSFTWTETGTTGYGVKAQDLQTIMPNVVSVDDDGLLGVNYGKAAMGIVVEACQRIVALEARIAELEAKAA